MKIKDIKVGQEYETKLGIGECVKVGGTFPVTVQMKITHPLPRGIVNMVPRDVLGVAARVLKDPTCARCHCAPCQCEGRT